MIATVKTFNGHNINDGTNYGTVIVGINSPQASVPSFVQITNADSRSSGAFTIDVKNIPLNIFIRDYANRYSLISQLKTWFAPGTTGNLVVTFNDDNVDYQIECTLQSLVQDPKYPDHFTAILLGGPSTWQAVTAETDTWQVTASGNTKSITVGGKDETRLVAAITASGTRAKGWLYQRLYQLVNVPKVNYGSTFPWSITLDTATLITANKMQADCDDLRILVGDKEVKRWIAGANTSTTKIWFNVNLGPGYSIDLLTAIGTGTVTTLAFKVTATNKASITMLPSKGIVYHGTEWIEYSAKNSVACKLTVKKRGTLGTTVQSHAAGDVFKFIPAPIYVVYGNTELTDPSLDDDTYDNTKPVFNLADSDNTKWVYDATSLFYYDDKPKRPGSWTPAVTRIGTITDTYNVKENAESGDPAAGMLMSSWQKGTLWQKDVATLSWMFRYPGGVYRVSTTGRKYRLTAAWPTTAAFQRSVDGKTWIAVWTEATPSNNTWTTLTHSNSTITSYMQYIRFVLGGGIGQIANASANLEVLTCTVEFYSTNIPTGTLGSEKTNYHLDITLKNTTTGDSVDMSFPMLLTKVFTLDGEEFEATYDDVNAHGAITLDDESRAVWIRLNPGVNSLAMTGPASDLGTLDIALSWYPRRL